MDVRPPEKDARVGVKFLEHTLDINTVRIAITVSAREHGYKLDAWLDDQTLGQDYDHVRIRDLGKRIRLVPVIPDSYFSLTVPQGRTHFFLEVDRGTMELRRFQTKILAYLYYYASGGYERRYKTKSLRVLTVTTILTRLAHLKEVTEAAGGKTPFYFTTLEQVTPQTVLHGLIWNVAGNNQRHALIDTN